MESTLAASPRIATISNFHDLGSCNRLSLRRDVAVPTTDGSLAYDRTTELSRSHRSVLPSRLFYAG